MSGSGRVLVDAVTFNRERTMVVRQPRFALIGLVGGVLAGVGCGGRDGGGWGVGGASGGDGSVGTGGAAGAVSANGSGGTAGSGGGGGNAPAVDAGGTSGALDGPGGLDTPATMDLGTLDAPAALDTKQLMSLTVTMTGGMGTCPLPKTYTLDIASKMLSWNLCGPDGGADHVGSQLLSDPEIIEAKMILSNLMTTDIKYKSCGLDKSSNVLTLVYPDHSDNYRDDFYSGCSNAPQDGIPFIKNMDSLLLFLAWASSLRSVPATFDMATFVVDPMPFEDTSPMAAACGSVVQSYKLTTATRELAWTLCRMSTAGGAFASVKGTRTLTEDDVGRVLAGLGSLVLGASGDCTTVRAQQRLYLSGGFGHAIFSGDIGACSPDWHGTPPFVIGLDAVIQTVQELAGNQ